MLAGTNRVVSIIPSSAEAFKIEFQLGKRGGQDTLWSAKDVCHRLVVVDQMAGRPNKGGGLARGIEGMTQSVTEN